jgi:hypothetical protein
MKSFYKFLYNFTFTTNIQTFFCVSSKKKKVINVILTNLLLNMPRSQKNDNFIDKTFTIVADILLRVIPTTQREKEAFTYYRDGVIRVLLNQK